VGNDPSNPAGWFQNSGRLTEVVVAGAGAIGTSTIGLVLSFAASDAQRFYVAPSHLLCNNRSGR
jgi:hypothetical protein